MPLKMPLHDWFFWAASFFLLGILLGSATGYWDYKILYLLATIIIVAGLIKWRTSYFNFLIIFIVIGAFYFYFFDYFQKNPHPILDQKIKFNAVVKESDLTIDGQELTIEKTPDNNLIKIYTFRYPIFQYGDYLKIEGVIKKTKSEFLNGVMYKPEITFIEPGHGWAIKSVLINVKNNFQQNLKKVLSYNQAVFLSGLTVGGRSEFSQELEEKFKKSGTLHLVALSGFNIMIIIQYVGGFFNYFISRKKAFWVTTLFIILFVIMAGAEASIIRAAIMGFILILAERSGRLFNVRNAITASALFMVINNPKVLAFNLGFQLSFLAFIGIIYLKPRLDNLIKRNFWLKKEFFTTIAAETSVLPFLFLKFGEFNLNGIITNTLIGYFIPFTMALGFLTGALGFISYYLSLPVAVLANILLSYELAIINLFGANT